MIHGKRIVISLGVVIYMVVASFVALLSRGLMGLRVERPVEVVAWKRNRREYACPLKCGLDT